MTSPKPAVLVVDDEADIRNVVAFLLEDEGYRVLTARDGHEALAVVAQEVPTAILLDMKMPRMDGWQFVRAFRAQYGRSAPVVIMTAAENAGQRAAEVEAEGYVGKPFDLDDLLRTLHRHSSPAG
jgi:CheY-like chemotaxis protein